MADDMDDSCWGVKRVRYYCCSGSSSDGRRRKISCRAERSWFDYAVLCVCVSSRQHSTAHRGALTHIDTTHGLRFFFCLLFFSATVDWPLPLAFTHLGEGEKGVLVVHFIIALIRDAMRHSIRWPLLLLYWPEYGRKWHPLLVPPPPPFPLPVCVLVLK